MKKFHSKSGLPEAIGSTAYAGDAPRPHIKPSEAMCDIPGCKSHRTNRDETLPDGSRERIYERGKGDVVIRTKDGTVHGYVCCFHYQKILDENGKDQLSECSRREYRVTQNEMPMKTETPHGLLDHLTKIQNDLDVHRQSAEDTYADQWASHYDDAN